MVWFAIWFGYLTPQCLIAPICLFGGLITRFYEPPETAFLIFLSNASIFAPIFDPFLPISCPTNPAEFPQILHFCLFFLISLVLGNENERKVLTTIHIVLFRVLLKPAQVSLRLGADARSHGHRSRGSDPALRRNPTRTPKRAEFTKKISERTNKPLGYLCRYPQIFVLNVTCHMHTGLQVIRAINTPTCDWIVHCCEVSIFFPDFSQKKHNIFI